MSGRDAVKCVMVIDPELPAGVQANTAALLGASLGRHVFEWIGPDIADASGSVHIAAGAFHVSKPSDMIPELQGRFPIRVELKSLTVEDFIRILKEPKNALAKQYTALLETEGIKLILTDDALEEVAKFAAQVNESSENIGARRLHTIMEKLLEEVSFAGPDLKKKTVKVDAAYVRKQLADIVKDQDLSRYIL
jgi:ATP-dependent HslUV protease ATP-binding subunit HslU